jgi:poly [ADP-ribose] polymerase
MMEMGLDSPDVPMGMLSDLHLERCKDFPFVSTLSFSFSLANNKLISSGEEVLLQFVEAVKSMKETGQKAEAVWSDYSQRCSTLLHSTRPFVFRDYQDLADHVRPTQASYPF